MKYWATEHLKIADAASQLRRMALRNPRVLGFSSVPQGPRQAVADAMRQRAFSSPVLPDRDNMFRGYYGKPGFMYRGTQRSGAPTVGSSKGTTAHYSPTVSQAAEYARGKILEAPVPTGASFVYHGLADPALPRRAFSDKQLLRNTAPDQRPDMRAVLRGLPANAATTNQFDSETVVPATTQAKSYLRTPVENGVVYRAADGSVIHADVANRLSTLFKPGAKP